MARKKLTKQEKKKAEAEQAEALRIEMEKERQSQLEEERERKILELQEAKERQKREKEENKIRRIHLEESCQRFGDINREIRSIYAEIRTAKEWNRYMRCNGLPNAYDPSDLRKYMHMWSSEMSSANQSEQNWLLQANEWSVLTQDQTVANLTRSHLSVQQPNLGDIYSKRVVEILGILDEIYEAINDSYALSESIVKDLHQLKFDLRLMLSDYIDQLSYKVLSNIERDMQLDGLIIAKYLYKSDVLKMQLWTMRDIPQPQLNEKEKLKESKRFVSIDFPALKLNLQLPPSIKCMGAAIRGMWLSYDHFSDYGPSFHLPIQLTKNLDICSAARREWKKREEIIKMSCNEDTLNNLDNRQDSTIMDVDKLHNEYVEEKIRAHRRRIGVDSLQLKEFEVNLRRYRIINGVYALEYLEQPEQDIKLRSNYFLRTLTGTNKLRRKSFFQYFRMPPPTAAGVRRQPEEAEAELKLIERGLSKLTALTIELPEDIIWFEPPTICRWETSDETDQSEKLEKKRQESVGERSNHKPKQSKKNANVVNDFDLLNIPPGIDLNCLMKEFVIPRLPDGYAVKLEEKSTERKNSILKLSDLCDSDSQPQLRMEDSACATHIKNVLQATNSPRPLHPKVILRRELMIKEREGVENDNAVRDSKTVYMLSQLLRDLDQLCTEQEPYIERRLEEISDVLSRSPVEEIVEELVAPEADFGNASFLKSSDFEWSFHKKELNENQPAVEESEMSEISGDDDSNICVVEPQRCEIGRWSVRDIHDSKFNEDKLAIQFRSGRLGYFGLAVNWFSNLPFQTWDLKPDVKSPGTILFNLTAAVVSIELSLTTKGVQLNSFQGGISKIIQDVTSKIIPLSELQSILKKSGINLFPDEDAFCYCESACEKNIVMESHLYNCMAYMGFTHGFSWSRWNIMQDSRAAVLLMRELVEHRKIPNHSTLLVTPLKACIVDCTEVSTSFVSTPVAGMNFYADLYHLNEAHTLPQCKTKQNEMDAMLRDNVAKLLQAVRPLSFC